MKVRGFLAGFLLVSVVWAGYAQAAIRTGFDANTLARNDDGSTEAVTIGFEVNFYGVLRETLFVNNNGNITFDNSLSTFTPFNLTSTGRQIIAPFFADVDTRIHGEPVRYGTGTVDGRSAFGVNWIDVDYFFSATAHGSQLNSFQLVMIDRSDIAPRDFDFEFNYGQILWETGDASRGIGGLGGDSARVGYSNGTGDPGTFFELAGSAVNGAFLDSNPTTGLIHNRLNSTVDGRYVFSVRSGTVIVDPPHSAIPEPGAFTVWALGLLGVGLAAGARRRRQAGAN